MKKVIIICAAIAGILTVNGVSFAANEVSYGTVGTGATATVTPVGVELSTAIGTGTDGSAYVRLNIDGGIALNAITSLSYTSKITTAGAGGYALEVVLNIDADGDATLEGTGIGWMAQDHNPATLGYVDGSNRGDNFLSGDNNPPGAGTPDLTFVTRDALGNYSYWDANDARNGLGSFWSPFSTIVPGMLPVNDIDGTDLVHSIDFVVGTSGNFDGMKAIVSSVELNGMSYSTPTSTPPTVALVPNALHVAPGSTVTVSVNMTVTDPITMAAISTNILYDPNVFTYDANSGVVKGNLLTHIWDLGAGSPAEGTLRVGGIDLGLYYPEYFETLAAGSGKLFTFSLKVKEDAPTGSSALAWGVYDGHDNATVGFDYGDKDGLDIILPLEAMSGASINVCPAGDLDGDCDVDFKDFAILAGNWLVGT